MFVRKETLATVLRSLVPWLIAPQLMGRAVRRRFLTMNVRPRLLPRIGLALLVATAACEDPVGVSGEGTFAITGTRGQPRDYQPTFAVVEGMGTATLTGNFRGTTCFFRVEPEFFRHEDRLTLRLTFVTNVLSACSAVLLISDYEVEFQAVPVGQYQIRVIYIHDGAGEVRRFDTGQVTVR